MGQGAGSGKGREELCEESIGGKQVGRAGGGGRGGKRKDNLFLPSARDTELTFCNCQKG